MTNRERLIEAMEELLWDRGYVGTSPKAIQDRAGAGQGSMYHHFTGKADLAQEALQRGAARLRTEAEALFCAEGTALTRVSAYLRGERDALRGCRLGRLVQDPEIVASADLRAPLQETFDWLQMRLREVLSEGVKRGEFSPNLDPASTAATIMAVLQGGYVLARAANNTAPYQRAIDGLIGLIAAQSSIPSN